ncbi:hypothetical protein L596_008095 [Steinernema carpocapsae]|uniref:Uncharacterized protein n=1 Tax=Steinernema carpocapsae TaxID=34508 RepID=A0A4V6A686_STECR|nr:hypothetical protein L596_008095 [Steinernema carpocapsae]
MKPDATQDVVNSEKAPYSTKSTREKSDIGLSRNDFVVFRGTRRRPLVKRSGEREHRAGEAEKLVEFVRRGKKTVFETPSVPLKPAVVSMPNTWAKKNKTDIENIRRKYKKKNSSESGNTTHSDLNFMSHFDIEDTAKKVMKRNEKSSPTQSSKASSQEVVESVKELLKTGRNSSNKSIRVVDVVAEKGSKAVEVEPTGECSEKNGRPDTDPPKSESSTKSGIFSVEEKSTKSKNEDHLDSSFDETVFEKPSVPLKPVHVTMPNRWAEKNKKQIDNIRRKYIKKKMKWKNKLSISDLNFMSHFGIDESARAKDTSRTSMTQSSTASSCEVIESTKELLKVGRSASMENFPTAPLVELDKGSKTVDVEPTHTKAVSLPSNECFSSPTSVYYTAKTSQQVSELAQMSVGSRRSQIVPKSKSMVVPRSDTDQPKPDGRLPEHRSEHVEKASFGCSVKTPPPKAEKKSKKKGNEDSDYGTARAQTPQDLSCSSSKKSNNRRRSKHSSNKNRPKLGTNARSTIDKK